MGCFEFICLTLSKFEHQFCVTKLKLAVELPTCYKSGSRTWNLRNCWAYEGVATTRQSPTSESRVQELRTVLFNSWFIP